MHPTGAPDLAEVRRLAELVLAPLAATDPRAARLHALIRALDERLAPGDDAEDPEDEPRDVERDPEIVELLVIGSRRPLLVTAAVADAVWNTMFVKEPTLFVDVALVEGGVARIRPSAVTGFRYHPGAAPPARTPLRAPR